MSSDTITTTETNNYVRVRAGGNDQLLLFFDDGNPLAVQVALAEAERVAKHYNGARVSIYRHLDWYPTLAPQLDRIGIITGCPRHEHRFTPKQRGVSAGNLCIRCGAARSFVDGRELAA